MVTILPAVPRKPSTAERFANAFNYAANAAEPLIQKYRERQVLEHLGLDPQLVDLSPETQASYFKSQFAPEKQLTPLQEAQKNLAEERLKALQGQQSLFKSLTSPQSQEGFSSKTDQVSDPLSNISDDNLFQLAAFAGQPGQEGILGNIAKAEKERRKEERHERTEKEKQYFKFNEPKLAQLTDTERKLEIENARFDRLENLFSDPSKFPNSFLASLFSKEGQLNDVAYSILTPEAQEAVKLIIDSTSNIKDTYGARVTNFDLQTYLKKLPSLLNSPEGKMRVLRDLQIMNRLNQLHSKGIQEIFSEKGGTDQIPFSTAENLYKKKFGSEEKKLVDLFVNPAKGVFDEKPDPQKYLGRKIKDPKTGEIFISDGIEWKPFKG
jgi:hypothetical protein